MSALRVASSYKEFENDPNTIFWTDGDKVFFRQQEINGADVLSFDVLLGGFAKDKKNCYLFERKLKDADPLSFQSLNYTYAADNNGVWTLGGRIPEADIATFCTCDDGQNVMMSVKRKLADGNFAVVKTIAPYGYAKDKNHVYYYDFQGKNKIIKAADAGTFASLNDSYFGRDKNSVFCGKDKLPKANPLTWKKLADKYYYSRDGARIYYFNRLMENADADTFEVAAKYDELGNGGICQLAKDKNQRYWNDKVISQEEFDKLLNA